MILLDTHVWIWFVHNDSKLENNLKNILISNYSNGLSISMISLWEVAKLVEKNKIKLPMDIGEWFFTATENSGINVLDLNKEVIIKSTQLGVIFHSDPADQIITATSIVYNIPLATMDSKIVNYPFVNILK